jgi:hypothetical protein
MGQGTIINGGPDGLYTLGLEFGKGRRDAIKAQYDARIAALLAKLPELESKRGSLDEELEAARFLESSAIRVYIEAVQLSAPQQIVQRLLADVNTARQRVLRAEADKLAIETPIESLKAEILGLELQISELMAGEIEATVSAWCADFTEDGSGPVATIEVPGERQHLIIAPGCRGPNLNDGLLLSRYAMTPSQAFFNAAILPGWQKFKPTYRIGKITAINYQDDTANVTLEPANSSAIGIDVNQGINLVGVSVQYMTCNCGAFKVGDRVVVQFVGQNWNTPKVIGFVDHPRPCDFPFIYFNKAGFVYGFEVINDELMAEISVLGGLDVSYRIDRGGWTSLTLCRAIADNDAGPWFVWGFPTEGGNPSADHPRLLVCNQMAMTFSGYGGGELFNVVQIRPSFSLTPGDANYIVELRVMKSGVLKFNAALRYRPNATFDETMPVEVISAGGITLRYGTGASSISRLEGYELFIQTGD